MQTLKSYCGIYVTEPMYMTTLQEEKNLSLISKHSAVRAKIIAVLEIT